jgi:quercetin dioxygenase-like cupin family protein
MMEGVIAIPAEQIVPEEHEHLSRRTGKIRCEQVLLDDPDTGVLIKYMRYPKGDVVPMHTHTCGHGYYVLKGTLHTNAGDYGPGSFVWFDAGVPMEHGATADEDVDVIYFTNKTFDITYLEDQA